MWWIVVDSKNVPVEGEVVVVRPLWIHHHVLWLYWNLLKFLIDLAVVLGGGDRMFFAVQ
jgi:hypothetical protein